MDSYLPPEKQQVSRLILFNEAERHGISPAEFAIKTNRYPNKNNDIYWPEPILSGMTEVSNDYNINLLDCDSFLSGLAKSISKTMQFPANTIFLHSLGIVASAMSKSFKFEYRRGEKPVNLYAVTAQPPSSGKSGVHEKLTEPVHIAFDAINAAATKRRKEQKIRIAAMKEEIKKSEKANNVNETIALNEELDKLYSRHDKNIVYTYMVDDATPEGVVKMMVKQEGVFNIVSPEADAINIILGNVYSDKQANHQVFLKGWDAERISVVRSGKDEVSTIAKGTFAVIAQDTSIKAIFEAGMTGRGISERFLILMEPTMLGKRDFSKVTEHDEEVEERHLYEYSKIINNIVNEDGCLLKFSKTALNIINRYRNSIEPELGDTGIHSNNMMRGFVGKADKQIMKIASILHAVQEWSDSGTKEKYVSDETVESALYLFKEIVKSYTLAADELGFTGDNAEYEKLEEKLQSYAEKGTIALTLSQLRNNIKSIKPFKGTPSLTMKLKDLLIPVLQKNNICILHENKVYINPKLKG